MDDLDRASARRFALIDLVRAEWVRREAQALGLAVAQAGVSARFRTPLIAVARVLHGMSLRKPTAPVLGVYEG